jgi:hypothetical protein
MIMKCYLALVDAYLVKNSTMNTPNDYAWQA